MVYFFSYFVVNNCMENYPFSLVPPEGREPLPDNSWLAKRPFAAKHRSLEKDAPYFIAGAALADAINTAIAVGDPLLLTGEPGTGKTQAAYYAAYQLGVQCIHFQVKSDSTARDLLYDFDMVRYFRDAHLQREFGGRAEQSGGRAEQSGGRAEQSGDCAGLNKADYVEERPLWQEIGRASCRERV